MVSLNLKNSMAIYFIFLLQFDFHFAQSNHSSITILYGKYFNLFIYLKWLYIMHLFKIINFI
jgi:hypothetical protein